MGKVKKVFVTVLFVFISIAVCLGVASCGKSETPSSGVGGHTHSYVETVNSKYLKSTATCTEKAVYYKSCSCGEKSTTTFEYGTALGHSYTNYINDDNATCESNGTETATCDHGCGTKDTRTIEDSALGHDYGKWISNGDSTHTKTCSHDDAHTVTENCHGGSATCTEQATCEDCNAKYGTALEHNYGASTYVWNGDKCTATRICLNDSEHKETETVTAEYVKDSDASCTTAEKGHYEATFTNITAVV